MTMNPGDLSWEPLFGLGETKIYEHTPPEKVVKRSKFADVIVVNKVKLDKKTLRRLNNLKFICVSATGFDNVDIKAARELGISVSNVHSYSANSVSQHVFALVLALNNKARKYNQDIINGRWQTEGSFSFWDEPIIELTGKVFGVLGFGNIGKEVANIAKAFGMKVIVSTNTPEPEKWPSITFVTKKQLFKHSNVISIHVPYSKSTHQMVDIGLLKHMKSNAFLINTSRGAVINDEDLYNHLLDEKIGGAGLDVLVEEPPVVHNKLIGLPNCVITPHQAWASVESRQRLLDGVVFNIKSFDNGTPVNVINLKKNLGHSLV